MTNKEGKCPYRNVCDSYFGNHLCLGDDFSYCGQYNARLNVDLMTLQERAELEQVALTSCDEQTLRRLRSMSR